MEEIIFLDKITKLSDRDNSLGVTIFEKLAKLSEEVGEVSAALLKKEGCLNASKSSEANPEEELVDVLIVTLDMLSTLGYGNIMIQEMIDRKTKKWEAKVK